jgi:uncharacterized damage-inducible protein DinB
MNRLPESSRRRLETQLDALDLLLETFAEDALERRPSSGKWSILENIAHLGRYHEVFMARMKRVLDEENPDLGRYRAEDDPEAAAWTVLPQSKQMTRIKQRRRELLAFVRGLSDEQLARTGVHPKLGAMSLPLWLEFFLLHEAHHLYRILWLSRTGE